MTRIVLLSFWLCLVAASATAQTRTPMWRNASDSEVSRLMEGTAQRDIVPQKYRTVHFDMQDLRARLATAPMEFTREAKEQPLAFSLPMPDGTTMRFWVEESPCMEPALAAQFPSIKTYRGHGIDNSGALMRCDFTEQGFHAIVHFTTGSSVFIDPFSREHQGYHIAYYKRDFLPQGKKMECGVGAFGMGNTLDIPVEAQGSQPEFGDCQYRTYRLALACTGEYSSFHSPAGNTTVILSAMTTSVNRVNSVYEKEFAVHLNLIANTNLLIYTNANTDPYNNNSGPTMLGQNQTTITNVIGAANYDIGHVFSTGGGGIAALGSVCSSSSKARGVTGSPAPVGDPFDIDYVAHEIGHQFGGEHTFNSQNGSCGGGNISTTSSFEPGSGTTIMAYAGICAPDDVQNNSDAYFHYRSMQQISSYITTGAGNGCSAKTSTGNSAPVLTSTGGNFTIPKGTPFMLTATATDADNDSLTYCWEQYDNQVITYPIVSTVTSGPIFRSFKPNPSPSRIFPVLDTILKGKTQWRWEVLPSVARSLNFRVTVRDNHATGGCTAQGNALITVANSGPFQVTVPNTAVTWPAISSQTVTWNVNGTTAAPVSCANVDIYLSTDGGKTFPTLVLANTPNDGSEPIIVPNMPTTTARILVMGTGNVFFDISDRNFTITAPLSTYSIATTSKIVSGCGSAGSLSENINIASIGGFTDPVTLSATGLPAGVTASFLPNPVTPGNTAVMTLSGISGVATGAYPFSVAGTSTTGTQNVSLSLALASAAPSATSIVTPVSAATAVPVLPTLSWAVVANASSYLVEIADNAGFSPIAMSQTVTTNSFKPTTSLAQNQAYFWRVTAINGCGSSSDVSASFTTGGQFCTTYNSPNVPKNISTNAVSTVTSTVAVSGGSTITDVNVIKLQGTHTWISDLNISLSSPSGTSVTLFDSICSGAASTNFDLKFDDAAAVGAIACPPNTGATYQALTPLSAFNGLSPNGQWKLTIVDNYPSDGGALQAWGIQLCSAQPCTVQATANLQKTSICAGDSIKLLGAGGLLYNWTGPNNFTSSDQNPVLPNSATAMNGTYSVTVTGSNGCSNVATVKVTINPQPKLTAVVSSQVSCNNGTNGIVNCSANSGSTPYQYSMNGGAFQTSGSFSALAAGTYNFSVKDSKGCTATATPATLANPTAVALNVLSVTDAACTGVKNGSISVNGSGGTAGYTYNINGGTYAASKVFNGLDAITHTLGVKDSKGCTTTTNAVVGSKNLPPVGSFTLTKGANGTIAAKGSATNGGNQYTWNFGNGTANVSGQFPSYVFTQNGSYTVTMIVANACGSDTVTQTVVIENASVSVSSELAANISLYPNPTKGTVFIAFADADLSEVEIVVYAADGKRVATQILGRVQGTVTQPLTLPTVAAGVYAVRISAAEGTTTRVCVVTE